MKATEEKLSRLHGKLADAMIRKLDDEELKAADMTAIAKFLSDNNITIGTDDPKAKELRDKVEKKVGGPVSAVLNFPYNPAAQG